MEPSVREVLNMHPIVKQVKFSLFNDLPAGVGSLFEEGHRRELFFKESDAQGILDAIYAYLQKKASPEENIVFDLHIVGLMSTEVGAILASNLRLWDNVKSLSYATPRRSECRIFETEMSHYN